MSEKAPALRRISLLQARAAAISRDIGCAADLFELPHGRRAYTLLYANTISMIQLLPLSFAFNYFTMGTGAT